MQTPEMLDCQRIYNKILLVSISKKRKNKYGLFHIHFSTINNFGRVVILALGLTNIRCRQGCEWLFKQYTERALSVGISLPSVVITNLEQEVIDAT
jgi:hypothetical protein